MEMIKTVNLHKSFGHLKVLTGVNQTIHKGEVVSIIGPSGGGKSTFLRCLNLLEKPTEGQIFFEGKEITGKKVDIDLHRHKMGMVFQQFNVFPHLSVCDNVTLAPKLLKKKTEAEAICWLQKQLGVTENGVYNAATREAVEKWQRDNGVETVDGVVNDAMAAALNKD